MDPRAYAENAQREWARGVFDLFLFGPPEDNVILILAGDAGSGKTRSLKLLTEMLDAVGLGHIIAYTATTNAAVQASVSDNCCTVHSALGVNTNELLKSPFSTIEDRKRFEKLFLKRHERYLTAKEAVEKRQDELLEKIRLANRDHVCKSLNPRCAWCVQALHTVPEMPGAACKPILVIDEYGMLSASEFDKLMFAYDTLSPSYFGKIVILVGSVSQLSWRAAKPLTESSRFMSDFVHSTNLWYNFRQEEDLADALSVMQFNTITDWSVSVLGRGMVGLEKATDPEFKPGALRIFNSDAERDIFNFKCSQMKKTVKLPGLRITGSGPDRDALLHMLGDRYKFLFGKRPEMHLGKDVLLTLNARAIAVKTLNNCYASGVFFKLLTDPETKKPCGVVLKTTDNESKQIGEVTIKNGSSSALFYPVAASSAINTFTAQGCTVHDEVIYIPPRTNYFMSSILPSAYVACSRVTKAENLFIASDSFLKLKGPNVPFFKKPVLDFKILYEMGYTHQSLNSDLLTEPTKKRQRTEPL
ncbi:ORF93-like protein [Bufonid herpesvirus 1]|uniref:ORF93-like protein n=1 Tax=Bufonid herpesvirus 1 TaxID=2282206 RepID=UPI000EB63947|nr:ORF93-like protein [Bufonid herpesvirus 1]AXF48535.1 ORF93-like protein [Bufonid herpesvirus 1]